MKNPHRLVKRVIIGIGRIADFDPTSPYMAGDKFWLNKEIADFFEEYQLSHLADRAEIYRLTPEQHSLLVKFHNLLEAFLLQKTENALQAIHLDPQWEGIQQLAKQASEAFIPISIRETMLDRVFEISDREFQEQVWIKGAVDECSSYSDAWMGFFDELGEIDASPIPFAKYMISEEEKEALKGFADHLVEYDLKNGCASDAKIISDPEWEKVREHARQVLRVFHRI